MFGREQVEQQIRDVLATESRAIDLSNALFRPGGLFSKLGDTEADRRLVAQSELFKEAQKRLSELQHNEAARFSELVQQAHASDPEGEYMIRLEGSGRP